MFEILPQTSKQTGHYQLEVQKEIIIKKR